MEIHKEKSTMEKISTYPITSTVDGERIRLVKDCLNPKCPERRLDITNKFTLNN